MLHIYMYGFLIFSGVSLHSCLEIVTLYILPKDYVLLPLSRSTAHNQGKLAEKVLQSTSGLVRAVHHRSCRQDCG